MYSSALWLCGASLVVAGPAISFRHCSHEGSFCILGFGIVMAGSLLPTQAELAGPRTLDNVREWTGRPGAVWQHLSVALGAVPNLHVLGLTLADIMKRAFRDVRITLVDTHRARAGDRGLTSVEVIQMALMWRIARQLFGLDDVDILSPTPTAPDRL